MLVGTIQRSNRFGMRSWLTAAGSAAVLALSACGGGGDGGEVDLRVGVYVDGVQSGDYVYSGEVQSVAMVAGSSIELDANEQVVWTLQVGSTYYEGFNTSVYYQGVEITATTLSSSRIALDTDSNFFLPSPVRVTLYAVSTFDSAIVATVDVFIGN